MLKDILTFYRTQRTQRETITYFLTQATQEKYASNRRNGQNARLEALRSLLCVRRVGPKL